MSEVLRASQSTKHLESKRKMRRFVFEPSIKDPVNTEILNENLSHSLKNLFKLLGNVAFVFSDD